MHGSDGRAMWLVAVAEFGVTEAGQGHAALLRMSQRVITSDSPPHSSLVLRVDAFFVEQLHLCDISRVPRPSDHAQYVNFVSNFI